MAVFKENDAARLTGRPPREVQAAWHQARNDSGVRRNPKAGQSTPALQVRAAQKMIEIKNRGR